MPAWAKDKVGTFGILANSADDVPRIAQAVDAMFLNTDAPTKTESEREFAMSFETMIGGVKQFMYGIMGAITFSLLLVMANTMAMSVRERTREVGTLKALGFQRGTIAWLFVGESLLIAIVGAALGIGWRDADLQVVDLSLYLPNFTVVHADARDADRGLRAGARHRRVERDLFGLSRIGADHRRRLAEHGIMALPAQIQHSQSHGAQGDDARHGLHHRPDGRGLSDGDGAGARH